EQLQRAASSTPEVDIVYGNFEPVMKSLFSKNVALCTLAPRINTEEGRVSQRFIASSVLKKAVWQAAGGFSDQRAAEDLEFMESVDNLGFKAVRAPMARVWWQMQPTVGST